MMLSIACCDDSELERDIVQDILKEYCSERKTEIEIVSFASGIELLKALDNEGCFDIYILDVMMPRMTGIELADNLRSRNEKGCIIFLTSSPDFVFDAFRIHAYQYLLKPIEKKSFYGALDEAVAEINRNAPNVIRVKTKSGIRRLKLDDILYVTRENRALCYHLADGQQVHSAQLRTTSQEMFAPLLTDKRFYMAGLSLLVNLSEIKTLEKGYVVLNDGTELYPPERSFSAMRTAWNSF